ncbi:5-methyltetrahydropteroyltriglutamate--homocysteine S-methyltransferase [Roseiarcaceae bacterium H3SJ34-1]|uniref:5-methyltetrahydropteroyltriglutamate-- homocysteine S-methyltransferase n=1 Tax=Terripilifer ovatus TaxID=3032367 RepID=UPI003AB99A7D|nr:5-methyltetrahydropteroyltriglutamate--homocysteine S-methyltransferase [Roseiarcaceae bacterium H3SJ34-1]
MSKGPFRADQVGSLLRPPAVKEARAQKAAGQVNAEELRKVEDTAIRHVVKLQEDAGMNAITDGEIRRAIWHVDFLTGFDGIEATQGDYAVSFKGKGGETQSTSSMIAVTGKVGRSKPIMVDHFKFLKSVTTKTPKFCIPSPTYMHMRGGKKVVADSAYPDQNEFWVDMTRAYRAEVADLVAAGCTYLQLDDVSFATMCDAGVRKQMASDGLDPEKLPETYANIINGLIAGRDDNLTVTLHTCRGNHDSMWMAEGGYEAVADALFNVTEVDGFFLEYDTDRAGGFAPLRFFPKGRKKLVLGLISSKEAALESKDMLKQRIDEASKYVALDQLCLSPQCGFASSAPGNRITEEIEKKKLELVVEVANEVWGTAA